MLDSASLGGARSAPPPPRAPGPPSHTQLSRRGRCLRVGTASEPANCRTPGRRRRSRQGQGGNARHPAFRGYGSVPARGIRGSLCNSLAGFKLTRTVCVAQELDSGRRVCCPGHTRQPARLGPAEASAGRLQVDSDSSPGCPDCTRSAALSGTMGRMPGRRRRGRRASVRVWRGDMEQGTRGPPCWCEMWLCWNKTRAAGSAPSIVRSVL